MHILHFAHQNSFYTHAWNDLVRNFAHQSMVASPQIIHHQGQPLLRQFASADNSRIELLDQKRVVVNESKPRGILSKLRVLAILERLHVLDTRSFARWCHRTFFAGDTLKFKTQTPSCVVTNPRKIAFVSGNRHGGVGVDAYKICAKPLANPNLYNLLVTGCCTHLEHPNAVDLLEQFRPSSFNADLLGS